MLPSLHFFALPAYALHAHAISIEFPLIAELLARHGRYYFYILPDLSLHFCNFSRFHRRRQVPHAQDDRHATRHKRRRQPACRYHEASAPASCQPPAPVHYSISGIIWILLAVDYFVARGDQASGPRNAAHGDIFFTSRPWLEAVYGRHILLG